MKQEPAFPPPDESRKSATHATAASPTVAVTDAEDKHAAAAGQARMPVLPSATAAAAAARAPTPVPESAARNIGETPSPRLPTPAAGALTAASRCPACVTRAFLSLQEDETPLSWHGRLAHEEIHPIRSAPVTAPNVRHGARVSRARPPQADIFTTVASRAPTPVPESAAQNIGETPSPLLPAPAAPPAPEFRLGRGQRRFLGLTLDSAIKVFFGGNALVALVVLGLIVIFLFREGGEFFGQNHENLLAYRRAGLEYVDILRRAESDHAALNRRLLDIRAAAVAAQTNVPAAVVSSASAPAAAPASLAEFDKFAEEFADAITSVRSLAADLSEIAVAVKTKFAAAEDRRAQRAQLLEAGRSAEAAAVDVAPVDFRAEIAPITGSLPAARAALREAAANLDRLLAAAPAAPRPELAPQMAEFRQLARAHADALPALGDALAAWDAAAPVAWHERLSSFLFGREWLTASFWQDWYGIVPLLTGSLLVSLVALAVAVPLALAAAVYVNQLATAAEQRLIKPAIEFIAAIPSVVLGFFGIAVLGGLLRDASQNPWLAWLPGFPAPERLNALTAGLLLALIAIPTIFTLAEDALANVSGTLREASFSLGASRLQTIVRVIAPAALSGILSAVLLGFGRVIGETMVVLLCAGNRIAIPDFTAGPGVVTQPVHTMTGIIAQEMGEVSPGTLHYRALFVIGILLFTLSLLINYAAQKIVLKYRHAT